MKGKLIVLFSFMVVSLSAQLPSNIRFGFKVAPQISWMNTDFKKVKSGASRVGWTVGTTAEWYLNENYVLTGGIGINFGQGGTLLHTCGGRLLPEAELSDPIYDTLPGGTHIGYSMRYFEIPLSFRMRTREMGRWRLTFEAPIVSLGLRMRARAKIDAPGLPISDDENINPEINLFNVSYGVSAGGEYSINDEVSLLIALEYRQGFIDITKDHGVLETGEFEDSKGTTGFLALKTAILF